MTISIAGANKDPVVPNGTWRDTSNAYTSVIYDNKDSEYIKKTYTPSSSAVTSFKNDIYSGVQGRYDALWAFTDTSKNYLATFLGSGEEHLMLKTSGKAYVTMNLPLFHPIQYDSEFFRHMAADYSPEYENIVLDVDTQKILLAAGVNTIYGAKIPSNPFRPLHTGAKRMSQGSITESGIFAEEPNPEDPKSDKRYYVQTRVPDSVNYHYERQKDDKSIPFLDKFHAQYQRPLSMSDTEFEHQLATARYLTGMEPYLSNSEAKQFEHFTYWRYKNVPSADPFRGAFIHIFLSRPDLHLLNRWSTAPEPAFRDSILGNPELQSLIYLNPQGALSLVGKWQTHAMTDINLFLSNRSCGIQMSNDQIVDHQFVDNFTGINLNFGGRMDNQEGDIDITFNETDDLSVSNTILLWMKYMHATYIGAISPLCDGIPRWDKANLPYAKMQHPLWRRLDSLASLYVIATDMTQRNIIFWRKYFGVYPKSAPFSGLGTEDARLAEGVRKVTIPFRYATFRTNNIMDLYAFNRLSDLRTATSGANKEFSTDMFQVKDLNVIPDHNMIAGLPFVAIESHTTNRPGSYNIILPEKMINPQLLFTHTDGAFMPNGTDTEMYQWVNHFWGGSTYNASVADLTRNDTVLSGGGISTDAVK